MGHGVLLGSTYYDQFHGMTMHHSLHRIFNLGLFQSMTLITQPSLNLSHCLNLCQNTKMMSQTQDEIMFILFSNCCVTYSQRRLQQQHIQRRLLHINCRSTFPNAMLCHTNKARQLIMSLSTHKPAISRLVKVLQYISLEIG